MRREARTRGVQFVIIFTPKYNMESQREGVSVGKERKPKTEV